MPAWLQMESWTGSGYLGIAVTDAYLLAMAVRHQGRFVTFDQRIPLDIVTQAAPKHLCVIPCDSRNNGGQA